MGQTVCVELLGVMNFAVAPRSAPVSLRECCHTGLRGRAVWLELREGRGDLMNDASIHGKRHVSHALYQDVAYLQICVLECSRVPGQDQLVEVAPNGHDAREAAWCRLREFGQHVAARSKLPTKRMRN